jgi:transposase
MRNSGMGSKSIAKVLGISRNTVRKYDILEKPVKKMTNHQNNYSIFIDQIQQMLDNQDTIKNIYKEIKVQGYSGSYTSLCEYLQKNPIHVNSIAKDPPSLSARKISIYLGMKRFNRIRSATEREIFRTMLKMSPLLRKLRKIYLSFKNILSKGKPDDLEKWINYALTLNLKHLNRVINGLKQDLDAVINAIKSNWSSGKVEGKINKLKTIKRQMYGRASLELLKRKVIYSKNG